MTWVTWEEDRDAACQCREKIHVAKAQLKLKLPELWGTTEESFFKYINDNPACVYKLGNEGLKRAAGRDLGVLADGKRGVSQQCPGSQQGHLCLGGHQAQLCWPERRGCVPLCSALGWPLPESWGQLWAPQYKKDSKPLEAIQKRPWGLGMGLEERLRDSVCSAWKRLKVNSLWCSACSAGAALLSVTCDL